jgi:hypothetical protein
LIIDARGWAPASYLEKENATVLCFDVQVANEGDPHPSLPPSTVDSTLAKVLFAEGECCIAKRNQRKLLTRRKRAPNVQPSEESKMMDSGAVESLDKIFDLRVMFAGLLAPSHDGLKALCTVQYCTSTRSRMFAQLSDEP